MLLDVPSPIEVLNTTLTDQEVCSDLGGAVKHKLVKKTISIFAFEYFCILIVRLFTWLRYIVVDLGSIFTYSSQDTEDRSLR